MHYANALLDNDPSCAVIELTLGGARIRCLSDSHLAVTGAEVPLRCAGSRQPMNTVIPIPAGGTMEIGTPSAGLRTYVAVRGGVDVPLVLGSRSTDTISGIGPPQIVAGTKLPVGAADFGKGLGGPATATRTEQCDRPLRVILGPRHDWFTPDAIAVIGSREFMVTSASNRAGIRLQGPNLQRRVKDELPSEGVVTGALQVPPSGQPILLFRDRPTTGGYPVIGVVIEEDLALVAQLRPGSSVRFAILD